MHILPSIYLKIQGKKEEMSVVKSNKKKCILETPKDNTNGLDFNIIFHMILNMIFNEIDNVSLTLTTTPKKKNLSMFSANMYCNR